MTIFMLDCDVVSEISSSLSSLASKVSEIGSSVNSYDVSCEDDFNFSTAKSSIISNIEACSMKIKNTAKLIDNVVNSHTSLQGSIASGDIDSFKSSNSNSNSSTGGSVTYSNGSGGGSMTSRGTAVEKSEASPEVSSYVGGRVSEHSSSVISNIAMPNSISMVSAIEKQSANAEDVDNLVKGVATTLATGTVAMKAKKGEDTSSETISDKTVQFRESIPTVEDVEKSSIDKVSNNIINNMKYRDDGYGLVDNKYVVSCDGSIGDIGDTITIKQADGQKFECVIGNVNGEKNKIDFYVNNNIKDNNIVIDIESNNVEIINNGQIASQIAPKTKVFKDRVIEVLGEEKEVL